MTSIRNSAQWRLVALAVLLPIAAVAVLLIWQDYQARRSSIITNLELKSAQINAQLEDFVNTSEASTGSLATLISSVSPDITESAPKAAGTLTQANELLVEYLARNPQFTEVAVVNSAGNTLAGSRPFTTGSRSDYALLLGTHVGSGPFTVSNVFIPAGNAEPYVLFSYLLEESDEATSYVVATSLLTTISGALDMSMGFPSSAKSGIFDGSGMVLAGTGYELPHPGGAVGRDISGSAVWSQVETSPDGAWFGPGLDEIDRIIFFEFPEKTPWVTTVAFAQAELFGPLWQRVWFVSGALLSTIAGTLLLVEIASRRDRVAWQRVTRERQTLQAVLDSARDGIMVLDATGSVEYTNRRLGDLFEIPAERLIGSGTSQITTAFSAMPGLSERDVAELERILVSGESPAQPLNIVGSNDCAIQIVTYPVRQSDGEITGLTLVAHDVTEETRIHRMKSEFVGNASHQLRTPLASILASSELLLSGAGDPAKQEARLRLVHGEALRMRETISSLLNLSQIESGRVILNTQAIDLKRFMDDIVESATERSESHEFVTEISDDADTVWADRSKLSEVMSSLIDNAVKYSPDGGRVFMSASAEDEQSIRVQIKDQGVGIDEADLPVLFSPYQRASAPSRGLADGTGLGLHIVHSLVELMGGKLSVKSLIGIGSTFTFILPIAPVPQVSLQPDANGDETERKSFSTAIATVN
ncbi:MAG: PAS domain-containing protein [Chloroflexi bacterium]|nr:PAS domain-containing protein [Chloroflexota bacterium]MBT4074002.1 PAS domain-containing protein [Chloroflexota bacterium]